MLTVHACKLSQKPQNSPSMSLIHAAGWVPNHRTTKPAIEFGTSDNFSTAQIELNSISSGGKATGWKEKMQLKSKGQNEMTIVFVWKSTSWRNEYKKGLCLEVNKLEVQVRECDTVLKYNWLLRNMRTIMSKRVGKGKETVTSLENCERVQFFLPRSGIEI